jgi:hypothetical protein
VMVGVGVTLGVKVAVGVSVCVAVGVEVRVGVGVWVGVLLGVGVGVASRPKGALQAAAKNAARPIAGASQMVGLLRYRPLFRLGRLTVRVYAVGMAGAMNLLGRLPPLSPSARWRR